MLLAIDAGNTNMALGLYDGDRPGPRWRLATDHARMPDEYGIMLVQLLQHAGVSPGDVGAVALASVVPPLTNTLVQACQAYLGNTPLVVEDVEVHVYVQVQDQLQVGLQSISRMGILIHYACDRYRLSRGSILCDTWKSAGSVVL